MKAEELDRIARELRAEDPVSGVDMIKRSRVRIVARAGDVFLKVFLKPRRRPEREARALRRARDRGLPVPEPLGTGRDWIATRFIEGRDATREDLAEILLVVREMHERGMLHRDLHLGNLVVGPSGIVLTDLQRALFLPWIPGILRRRELGWLAYSLGDPVPATLVEARLWRDLRAQTHWRSRTRRCVTESGAFTRFRADKYTGFRRRDVDPEEIAHLLMSGSRGERLKDRPAGRLFRKGTWILKEHRSTRAARRSWINGHGLEMRGIRTGRPVAWAGRWIAMEDAGPTVTDFVEERFAAAAEPERNELGDVLADLMADLHSRGIYHADLKANNIAWLPGEEPGPAQRGVARRGGGPVARAFLPTLRRAERLSWGRRGSAGRGDRPQPSPPTSVARMLSHR
jgi:tRNA A-37 threonylcarbamoyl transferase component Bud32